MTKNKIKLSYYGPTKTQDGIGLASKLHLEALKRSKENQKLDFLIKEFKLSRKVGFQKNIDLIDKISFETLYKENSPINYFHFSPRWIRKYLSNKEKDFLKSKINIGYWVCEAQKIPDKWIENIDFYDEIWTSSTFCKRVYEKYLNIPVKVINHPVPENEISEFLIRRYNNNNHKPFTFLTIANAFSDLKRKNSIAVIKAFKKAFKSNDYGVKLIVKLTNSKDDIEEFKKIFSLIQDYENIELINEHLSPIGIEKLYQQADTYVSLHRSEGFGITISDAYSFGIPVIATGYSGNLDIISNKENDLLVDYDLTSVGEERLRYHSDDIWAEPDIDNAKEKMIKVREDFNYSFEEALKVRKALRENFNLQRIGEKMHERITSLIC